MVTRSRSNSRSSRSCTISRCSRPRKPQRKPKPRAALDLRLEVERRVVQPQLGEQFAQLLELGGVGREQAAEHHRHRGLEARQHLGRGLAVVGDGVAHLAVGDGLDAGDDEADLARPQLGHVLGLGREHADLVEIVGGGGRHHADAQALPQHAVLHPHQGDDAEIGVVPAVDQQRLQGRVAVALGRRQALDHGFQQVVDAEAGLGRHARPRRTCRCRSRPRSPCTRARGRPTAGRSC